MTQRRYTALFTAAARKQLAQLDRAVQRRILAAVSLLARKPRPPAARRLVAPTELWRVRIGDYRVIYTIADGELLIVIVRVGHRGGVYRRIEQL